MTPRKWSRPPRKPASSSRSVTSAAATHATYCYDKLIKEAKLLNRITNISGQWHRSRAACVDLGYPKGTEIPEATLGQYGFENMEQFRNWRWDKGMGGGPLVDLGSHQIDVYSWFLDNAKPASVMASGGTDYWKNHEWYDNAIAIFEFPTKQGLVRATYPPRRGHRSWIRRRG